MSPATVRTFFAIFLIAHGLMTMSLSTVPVPALGALHTPYFPAWWRDNVDNTWPASRLGIPVGIIRIVGSSLWMAVLVCFAAAGAGLLGLPGLNSLWQIFAAAGAFNSLILLALYWHPWLFIGLLLNISILVSIFAGWFTRWFPTQ
jgi:hypothetical protein